MKTKSSKLKKPLNIKKSIASIITKNVAKEKKQLIKSDSSNSKDIISLILRDHEPIKKLILVLKDSEASIQNKRPAYLEFKQLLSRHAKAEQDSLYVRMKKEDVLRVEALEGEIEHSLSDQLMSEIQKLEKESDKYTWMAKVLEKIIYNSSIKESQMMSENESLWIKTIPKDFLCNLFD